MDEVAGDQLSFWGKNGVASGRCADCLVSDFIEENDSSCKNLEKSNYEVIECGTQKSIEFINDCRGILFTNISALPVQVPQLPRFIPTVKKGSHYMLSQSPLPWVAITLADVVSPKELVVAKNIRQRIGVPAETKLLLLCYASDSLIEKIWKERDRILPQLACIDVDLMTAIDYSVFWDQPHLERLVNMKRSLVTFDIFQQLGTPAIPHLYWSSKKDIERWAEWLRLNPSVTHVAMYWGLFKDPVSWRKQVKFLEYFNQMIDRPITQLISGPSTLEKINDLLAISPQLVITSGSPARAASNKLKFTADGLKNVHPDIPFLANVDYFTRLTQPIKKEFSRSLGEMKIEMSANGKFIITGANSYGEKKQQLLNFSITKNLPQKEVAYAKKQWQTLEQ